jgi:hypothetical protein
MLNFLIRIKPHISTLGQPLWKRLPALDWVDPLIPRHRRVKRLRHGGDVCGLLCWWWMVLSVLFLLKESYGKGVFCSRRNLIAVKLLKFPTSASWCMVLASEYYLRIGGGRFGCNDLIIVNWPLGDYQLIVMCCEVLLGKS